MCLPASQGLPFSVPLSNNCCPFVLFSEESSRGPPSKVKKIPPKRAPADATKGKHLVGGEYLEQDFGEGERKTALGEGERRRNAQEELH